MYTLEALRMRLDSQCVKIQRLQTEKTKLRDSNLEGASRVVAHYCTIVQYFATPILSLYLAFTSSMEVHHNTRVKHSRIGLNSLEWLQLYVVGMNW